MAGAALDPSAPTRVGSAEPERGGLLGSAIRASGEYAAASVEQQSRIEALVGAFSRSATTSDLDALRRIVSSPFWRLADEQGRDEVLELLALLPLTDLGDASSRGPGVRRPTVAVAELAEAKLNGVPMLLDRAHGGGTLVHHLTDAAHRCSALSPSGPVLSQTGLAPAYVAGGLVLEVSGAGSSREDPGTPVARAVQALAEQEPAEYVRLCAALIVDASVATRSGEGLERDPSAIPPAPGSYGSLGERLLETALLGRPVPPEPGSLVAQSEPEGSGRGAPPPVPPLVLPWTAALPDTVRSLWPDEWRRFTSAHLALGLRR